MTGDNKSRSWRKKKAHAKQGDPNGITQEHPKGGVFCTPRKKPGAIGVTEKKGNVSVPLWGIKDRRRKKGKHHIAWDRRKILFCSHPLKSDK